MPHASSHPQIVDAGDRLPAVDRIKDLQGQIEAVLKPLLPASGRYAVVDYPNYSNVGDSAIWLGSAKFLSEFTGRPPIYLSETVNHSKGRLATRLEGATIFIQGGGNFGDIWVDHQQLREQLLLDFPETPIVQLPQSIKFNTPSALKRTRDIIKQHQNFVLLVRDRESLDIARNEFSCPSHLCPDMAFWLGPLPRPADAGYRVAYLLRTDLEAQDSRGDMPSGSQSEIAFDWLQDWPALATGLDSQLKRYPRRLAFFYDRHPLLYDWLARTRLKRGCRQLSQGQVVVTDRLHGHILCLLLGIPHVILDNNYGKISNYYRCWTHRFPGVHVAESLDAAAEWARTQAVA